MKRDHVARLCRVEAALGDAALRPIVAKIANARGVDERELLRRTRARLMETYAAAHAAGLPPLVYLARQRGLSTAALIAQTESRLRACGALG